MTAHRITVVNCEYFTSKTMTAGKADRIVDLIPKDTDVVVVCEAGLLIRRAINGALNRKRGGRWSRKGARPGLGREGVNGILWNRRAWKWTGREWFRTLTSGGQWPRFLVMVRLEGVADPVEFVQVVAFHLAAKGAPLSASQADRVKRDQTNALRDFIGNKRVLGAGDFPRTGDDDDLAYLKREGVEFHGRTDRTPLTVFTRRGVSVSSVKVIESGQLLDHDLVSAAFTVPGKTDA